MEAHLLALEPQIRFGAAFGALALMAAWEAWRPARLRFRARTQRWTANLVLALASAASVRLAFPLAALGAAAWAEASRIGVFHWVEAPAWFEFICTIVALDLALYLQHRAMHRAPALWRLHRVHHADAEVDVTTGLRFHPIEALISMLWKAAIVAALGAPIGAVIAFEIALNALASFNHANVRLPARLERLVRAVLITPSVHRLHHDRAAGADAPNFGFSTSLWDRLFGTWRAEPEPQALGLAEVDRGSDADAVRLLVMPFRP